MHCGECGFGKHIPLTPQASPCLSSPRFSLNPGELQSNADGYIGKRESGLSYSLSLQIFGLSLTLRHCPTWHRETRAQHGPRTLLRARPSLLLPSECHHQNRAVCGFKCLEVGNLSKKASRRYVCCKGASLEMGGWSQRALQQAEGGKALGCAGYGLS